MHYYTSLIAGRCVEHVPFCVTVSYCHKPTPCVNTVSCVHHQAFTLLLLAQFYFTVCKSTTHVLFLIHIFSLPLSLLTPLSLAMFFHFHILYRDITQPYALPPPHSLFQSIPFLSHLTFSSAQFLVSFYPF